MTLDGLDAYVRSWTPTISSWSSGCVFAQVFLNGMPLCGESAMASAVRTIKGLTTS